MYKLLKRILAYEDLKRRASQNCFEAGMSAHRAVSFEYGELMRRRQHRYFDLMLWLDRRANKYRRLLLQDLVFDLSLSNPSGYIEEICSHGMEVFCETKDYYNKITFTINKDE